MRSEKVLLSFFVRVFGLTEEREEIKEKKEREPKFEIPIQPIFRGVNFISIEMNLLSVCKL